MSAWTYVADGAETGGDAFFFNRYLEAMVKVAKDDDALDILPSIDIMADDDDNDASVVIPADIGNIQTSVVIPPNIGNIQTSVVIPPDIGNIQTSVVIPPDIGNIQTKTPTLIEAA